MQGIIKIFYLTILIIHISKLMYFNVPGHDGTIRSERRIVFVRLIKNIPLGFQRKLPEKLKIFINIHDYSIKSLKALFRYCLPSTSIETVDRISTESYLSFTYICILRIWHEGIHIYGTCFAWWSDISVNWSGSCQFLFVVSNK